MRDPFWKNRHALFKKRHYVTLIKETVSYCTKFFGYKTRPYVFESENNKGDMMCIVRGRKNRYAIFYDYMQFKRFFGDFDCEVQTAYAAFFIAHEMRHYYQMRQIKSKHPEVDEDTLAKWRANDEVPLHPSIDGCSILDFYLQPMELDATLFAYVFVAEMFDCCVRLDYIDEEFVKVLEKHYISLFGKTDERLFGGN